MKSVRELQEERIDLMDKLKSIDQNADSEQRDLNATEKKEWDKLSKLLSEKEEDLARAKKREEIEELTARRHIAASQEEKETRITNKEKKPYSAEYKNVETGKIIRAYSRGDDFLHDLSPEERKIRADIVLFSALFKEPSDITEAEKRGYISTSSGAELTQLVMPQILNAITEKMLPTRLGGSILQLDANKVSIAKVTSNPSVNIKAESESWSLDSDTALDSVTFTPFNAGLLISVSKEMIQDCNGLPEAIYKAFTQAIADHITDMFLNGVGTTEPTGLINLTGVNAVTASALLDYQYLIEGYVAVLEKNGLPTSMVLAPREFGALQNLKNSTNGDYLAPPESIKKLEQVITNHIPTDLGTGSNESYALIGGSFKNNCLVGMRQGISVSSTDLYELEKDRITFRASIRYDIQTLYPELIAKLTGIVPAT